MGDGFYRQVTRALSKAGYSKVPGGKGSHEKWTRKEGPMLLVPRKLLSRHTANAIMKDAGLNTRF